MTEPTRRLERTIRADGTQDEREWAPVCSVELSMSAAQAKEQGLLWAITTKAYGSDINAAGITAHKEMQFQIALAQKTDV
jgi:hypothetical protein